MRLKFLLAREHHSQRKEFQARQFVALSSNRLKLELRERCDKCGAQAKIGAAFLSGELFFCGHHAKSLSPHLFAQAITIYDPEKLMEGNIEADTYR